MTVGILGQKELLPAILADQRCQKGMAKNVLRGQLVMLFLLVTCTPSLQDIPDTSAIDTTPSEVYADVLLQE